MLGGWISRIARAGSVVVAATALVAFVAYWPHAPWTAGNPYIHVPREDMRPVLRNVAAAWRAGDRLLVYDGAAAAVRFYWRGDSKDVIALPPFSPGDAATVERMRTALARAADDMRRTPRGDSGRAWLVLSHADPGDEPILQRQLADFGAPSAVIVSADGASASRLEPLPPRP